MRLRLALVAATASRDELAIVKAVQTAERAMRERQRAAAAGVPSLPPSSVPNKSANMFLSPLFTDALKRAHTVLQAMEVHRRLSQLLTLRPQV